MSPKNKLVAFLRWTEKYTGTDMVYLAHGGFWTIVDRLGSAFISIATLWAFGNWLSQEAYGVYRYVIAAVGIASISSLTGLGTALIKSVAQGKEGTLLLAFRTKFRWAFWGSAGLAGMAIWHLMGGDSELALLFLASAAFLPWYLAPQILGPYWTAKKRFDRDAQYRLAIAAVSTVSLIGAIYVTDRVLTILLVFFSVKTLASFFFYNKTKQSVQNPEEDGEAVRFGKSLSAMEAVEEVSRNLDKVLMWFFLGPVQVAVYSFAQLPLEKAAGFLPILSLALPKLGEGSVKEKKGGIRRKFFKLLLVFVPGAVLLALLAPPLFRIAFPQYMESVPYFQALTAIIALSPFLLPQAALIADARMKELYVVRIAGPALKILLFAVLLPIFGIWGVVAALIASEAVSGALAYYYFRRI